MDALALISAQVGSLNSTVYFGPIGHETKQDVRSILNQFGSIKKIRFREKYNCFAVRFEEKENAVAAIHKSLQEEWSHNARCEWNRISFGDQILPLGIAGYPAQQAILKYFEANIRDKCNHFITFFSHLPQNPKRATTIQFTPEFLYINNSKYRHGNLGNVMGPVPKDNEEVVVLVDCMLVAGIQEPIPNWIQIRPNRLRIEIPFWIFEEAVSPSLALPIDSVTVVDPPAVNPEFPTEMVRYYSFSNSNNTPDSSRSRTLDPWSDHFWTFFACSHTIHVFNWRSGRDRIPNSFSGFRRGSNLLRKSFSVNIRFNWRLQKRIQETFPTSQKQWIQMSEKRASSRRGISIDTFPDQRIVIFGRNGIDGVEKHQWTTMQVLPRHF